MYLGSLDLLLEISGVDYSPQFEWNVNFHFYFFHQNGKERDFMLREAALVFSATYRLPDMPVPFQKQHLSKNDLATHFIFSSGFEKPCDGSSWRRLGYTTALFR